MYGNGSNDLYLHCCENVTVTTFTAIVNLFLVIYEIYPLYIMVNSVHLSSDVYLVCLSHALSTESEEVMGLLLGEVGQCGETGPAIVCYMLLGVCLVMLWCVPLDR